jgi:cellobiose phosphorylase
MNIMMNGWLLYQVIACRLWARSAFYQSGGAFGFRDQLQDVMAAAYSWPELIKNQILLHSSRQFVEGDVRHWWHKEAGRGIRTRYSDDLLWLPYVTCDYVERTGDYEILDLEAGFLESERLRENEDERYEIPVASQQADSVYEHCIRAIELSLRYGSHGIPLMGSGDWNDGMNTVGNKGRGESIWLGWFLYTILKRFIPVCMRKNDLKRAQRYEEEAVHIAEAIEAEAWDGSWYRRAYFDNGAALGSAANSECRIDSIAQSWSVISGAGRPARAREAMSAVEKYLIDHEEGIIKLLTPPFDEGSLRPGYIRGYVPGVRENGGQYTHAATWVILAFAGLGMGGRAWQLFHMINPVNHSRTSIECSRYKVEPYVMAADVYAVPPNTGRGGWTWYTGAAGWLYRVGLESLLGVRKEGNRLYMDPCIPPEWEKFEVEYTFENSMYQIEVANPDKVSTGIRGITVDGQPCPEGYVALTGDGLEHKVRIVMGNLNIQPVKAQGTHKRLTGVR